MLLLGAAACVDAPPKPRETSERPEQPPAPPPATLVAVGDIARCYIGGDEITAALVEDIPGTIALLGDNTYEREQTPQRIESAYRDCFEESWGRLKARARPTPGNHEYLADGAPQYYAYFGDAAGPAGRGYYSYTLGDWHVISLNSNVAAGEESAQLQWLREDLAANRSACAVAYWHHPRFSSGEGGNDSRMAEVWRALDDAGVDLVLAGHDHNYERFAPQTHEGAADADGIRQFVVGTGGGDLRPMGARIRANSEVRQGNVYGVLKLVLHEASYDWEFIAEPGSAFRDSGSDRCR